ncbi:unnamed protein product [Orchesella dallaii]|uniref:Septin n=1 Tax=Orchesella dallaii TaxID=48710 RepID=A0ABP1S8Q1_9HEXA
MIHHINESHKGETLNANHSSVLYTVYSNRHQQTAVNSGSIADISNCFCVISHWSLSIVKMKLSKNIRELTLSGRVGFDSLPDQLVNKAKGKGFDFNILCIGETGIGKSTLMETLFNTKFDSAPAPHTQPSVSLKSESYELVESNVQMNLTIVDTVGYGDQVNQEGASKPIVEFINKQFFLFFEEELKTSRCLELYKDTRIHACLYFISPTGHGLKPIDLLTLKLLDGKVNIIPIIAKADALCSSELQKLKMSIMADLKAGGVHIYVFPTEDGEGKIEKGIMYPLAVVGGRDLVQVGVKTVRGRQYPWGTVEVENEAHCDFVKLRELLIRTNIEDLRELTHQCHYELYRKTRLEKMGFKDENLNGKPLSVFDDLNDQVSRLQDEMAKESEVVVEANGKRLEEEDAKADQVIKQMQSKFDVTRMEMEEEMLKLEESKKELHDEMAEFQRLSVQHQMEKLSTSHRTLSLGTFRKPRKSS